MVFCKEATRTDMQAFKEMYYRCIYLGMSMPVRYSKSDEEFEKMYIELVDKESIVLVQNAEGENAIGYAICRAFDDGTCILDEIYIEPEYRKKGYCAECMQYLCTVAKKIGMKKMTAVSITVEIDCFLSRMKFRSKNYSEEYELEL